MVSLRLTNGRKFLALVVAALSACSVNDVLFSQGDASVDAGGDGSLPARVTLLVTSAQLAVVEGRAVMLGVSLSERPAGAVTVTVSAGDAAKLGVSPAQLTFAPDEFAMPQTVAISALEDADAADESVQVSVTSPGLAAVAVAVAIDDKDGLALVTSPAQGLEVTEGLTEVLAVRLSAQPTSTVTAALVVGDGSVAGVSPAVLTFTPGNWEVEQSVTVTGRDDANAIDDTATLAITGSGVADGSLPIKVFDDDVQAIVPSTSNLGTMVEEGGSRTFTVRLSQAPSGTVVIAAESSVPSALAVSPASLTFTAATWNAPQLVTVTAPHDVDVVGAAAAVRLTATGLTSRLVSAGILDDDEQRITATSAASSVTEGQTATLGVRLAFRPESETTVQVSSAASEVVGVSPATLVFTPASYATPQQVTLTGVPDLDAVAEATTVRLQSGALLTEVSVDVVEDDALTIETSAGAVSLGESGSVMFGVRLTAMPLAPVTVAVASADTGAATVAPAQLVFDGSTWNSFQMVTVAGVGDEDVASELVAVGLTAAGLPARSVSAQVVDDDVQELLVSTTSVSLVEGGSTSFTVRLRYRPGATTSVAVATSDAQVAAAAPSTLLFSAADYATPKTVTVTAVQDANAASDAATISMSTPGVTSAAVAVAVTDDDTLAITASAATVNVVEGGTGSFTVRLTAQPLTTTTVTVASQDASIATVGPAALTFTSANWNTPQAVVATGTQDADAVAEATTVMLRAGGLAGVDVAVTVAEDDVLEIVPTAGSVALGERGQASFGVRLGAQPVADVVVGVASGDVGAATVSPATLTFTPANWNLAQGVTVAGANDPDANHETVAISLTAAGLAARTVTANVTDDDTLAVLFSTSSISPPEGSLSSIGVYLGAQPAGNVTVTVSSSDLSSVTVAPTTFTFTPANYSQFQQVNLRAEQDADATSEVVTISGSGPGLVSGSMVVNVTDDDTLAIVLSAGPMSIGETGVGTFTVQLSAQPESDVAVQLGSSDLSAVVPSPTSVVFTPGSWNLARTITLSGVDDADLDHEVVTIEARTMVGIAARTFSVSIADDDLLALSPGSLTLCEGAATSFGVTLGNAPFGGATTVTLSGGAGLVTVVPVALGFSSSGTQSAVVNALAVSATQSTTLVAAAPGLVPRSLGVTVLDSSHRSCAPPPFCGDGMCNNGESSATCPQDCGSSCGDGVCNGGETSGNCPEDCGGGGGFCGDGTCSFDEGLACNCEVDCGPFCR